MITPELEAWLGEAADEMTMDQVDLFARLATAADGLDPKDDEAEIQGILTAAHLYAVGDLDLGQEAAALDMCVQSAYAQRMRVYAAIRFCITEGGMSEYRASKITGITRATVRKYLGK